MGMGFICMGDWKLFYCFQDMEEVILLFKIILLVVSLYKIEFKFLRNFKYSLCLFVILFMIGVYFD